MSRKAIAFIVVPILLFGGWRFSGYLADQKELPPERPKPVAKNYVKVRPVSYSKMPVEIEAFGRLNSLQQINLIPEVGGKLLRGQIALKEGAVFRKGQVLIKVDDAEEKLTLQSRKSNFLSLLASILPDLKIDFPKSFDQWQMYFDGIDLDKPLPEIPKEHETKIKTYLASKGILTDYYAVKSLEETLKRHTIYAPYTGTVQSVNLEVGSVVSPGAVIATIIRTDQLELKVPIQKQDVAYVSIGETVKVIQEETAKSWFGKIVRRAPFIDPNNQSLNVYIAVDNTYGDLYDGLYLKAAISGKYVEQGMLIERNIIRNKNEVFVIASDSLLHTKKINIAKITENDAIIHGLDPGDLLVVDAPSNASNNMVVEVVNEIR
ncbi:MAG: efflux RND transporter periplasmic adaptor subunit [Cytophagales bacterium]|nr:efflux RND transporter periplasmic adaptor subunit [Cytophagales bacterium]